MKKVFFTPGPSQLYPTVQKHIKEALAHDITSISHRSTEFQEIYKTASNNLRKLLKIPADYHIFYLSSGTEAMERVIQNCVEKKSFHVADGAFSDSFQKIASDLGKKAELVRVRDGAYIDCLKINVPKDAELICLTQNETSTGVVLPSSCIRHVRQAYAKTLIALDIVSSAPDPVIDFKNVDCIFFSTQKGFGLPAGLGVLIVSPNAVRKSKLIKNKHISVGSYHTFERLVQYEEKFQTPETPNVLDLYLLSKVSGDMLKKSIKTIRADTHTKAVFLYDLFERHNRFKLFAEKHMRSETVVVVEVLGGSGSLIRYLASRGFIVGSGYGEYKDKHMRIANFPAHTMAHMKRLAREIKQFCEN